MNPSSTVTRQTKCLSPFDTKRIGGIWAHFGRVSRCKDGCLGSSEEVPAQEPQRVALVWTSVLFVDQGLRFCKKNVQARDARLRLLLSATIHESGERNRGMLLARRFKTARSTSSSLPNESITFAFP